jgi:hypothetical protein
MFTCPLLGEKNYDMCAMNMLCESEIFDVCVSLCCVF